MTPLEKQLLRRVDVLERRQADILSWLGIEHDAMDEYDRAEAIDLMVRSGGNDPSLIKQHLKKVNGRRASRAECGIRSAE